MKRFTICTLIVLVAAIHGFSQTSVNDWAAVEGLRTGTQVIVLTKDGNETKAKIKAVASDRIELTKGAVSTISRADVQQVYRTRRGGMVTRALVGAAAGAGIGLVVGAGIVAAKKSDPLTGLGTVMIGIPVGAAVGAITTPRKRGKLVYSAR